MKPFANDEGSVVHSRGSTRKGCLRKEYSLTILDNNNQDLMPGPEEEDRPQLIGGEHFQISPEHFG